jgi:hypothetical protein
VAESDDVAADTDVVSRGDVADDANTYADVAGYVALTWWG